MGGRAVEPVRLVWPRLKRILSVLGWGLFVAVAVMIWPASLGGSTSYVIVTGHSMEPTLYPGDLAVLRKGSPQVGDVVSYRPFEDVQAQVIHRVLELKDDGTLVLQGDNNDFIDPFFPTVADVSGRMVFAVSHVGSVAWLLGRPLVWGSLLLIALALFLYGRPAQGALSESKAGEGGEEAEEA